MGLSCQTIIEIHVIFCSSVGHYGLHGTNGGATHQGVYTTPGPSSYGFWGRNWSQSKNVYGQVHYPYGVKSQRLGSKVWYDQPQTRSRGYGGRRADAQLGTGQYHQAGRDMAQYDARSPYRRRLMSDRQPFLYRNEPNSNSINYKYY